MFSVNHLYIYLFIFNLPAGPDSGSTSKDITSELNVAETSPQVKFFSTKTDTVW